MAHNFKLFPELTNSQMEFYYWDSPHKQILEDFPAKVIRVIDGDTIEVETDFRDFKFPIRFANTAAPELDEEGGLESKNWLETQILNEEVMILIDPKHRVGKFGRILGEVLFLGMNINEASMTWGQAIPFGQEPII